MFGERKALLEAVLTEPASDHHRLVYADWLGEHGEPGRAEFIRLQCRIAAIERECLCGACVRKRGGGQHHNGPCAVDKERNELSNGRSEQAFLRRRERELWTTDAVSLAGLGFEFWHALGVFPGLEDTSRGFVSRLTCAAEDWFDDHADALAWHPDQGRPCPGTAQPIERVTLTTDPANVEEWDGHFRPVLRAEDGITIWRCDRWPGVEFRPAFADETD